MRRIHSFFFPASKLRLFQRGASTTEYAVVLSFALLFLPPLYGKYSGEIRAHVARAADKFAEYYYQGWFWPHDDVASSGTPPTPRAGQGTGSSGGPSEGSPSSPGSAGGGNPLAGGGGGSEQGDADSGNNGSGNGNASGNNGQQPGGDPFGGNADNPQLCSASPGSNASTQSFAGNPIDIGTGNKLQIETDYVDTLPDGLHFIRAYNAFQGDIDIGMGHGWRHTWQRAVRENPSGTVTMIRADGSHFVFARDGADYRAPMGVVDRLQRIADGWQYTTGFGAIERYDTEGWLQQIAYPSGVSHTVHYDGSRQLVAVSDSRGARIDFVYDSNRLVRVALPDRTSRQFTYDEADRLTAVHRQSGIALPLSHWLAKPDARYRYEDARFPYALTELDDASQASYAAWAYDALGRAIRSQHGDGAERIDIQYVNAHSVIVTNAAGHPATYTLEPIGDGRRRVVAIDGESGLSCPELRQRNRYDTRGFLALAIDGGSQGRVFERDARGRIETEYRGVSFAPNEHWQPVEGSLKLTRRWHPHWPLVTEEIRYRHRAGNWLAVRQSDYRYDAQGHLTSDTHTDRLTATDRAPHERRWTYTRTWHDAQQTRLATLRIEDPLGRPTQLNYDEKGRLRESRNPLGQSSRFTEQTPAGLPGKISLPNGLTVALQYDDQQRLTRIQRDDETTTLTYQANGLVNRLQLPDGSGFDFTYNAARQLTAIRNERGETQQRDPSKLNGDWLDNTIADSDGNPVRRHHRQQDEWGRLIAWLGNNSQLTELTYDKTGDIIATAERHEDPGEIDSVRRTRAHYDTLHRLTALIDAAGYRTRVDYSPSGQIESVVDANANTTRFERNGFGDVLKETNPARGSDTYAYDAVGNVIHHNQTALTYDALDRLTAIDAPGDADDIRYTYDQRDTEHGNGIQQLTRIDAADHRIDYRYDDQGRLIAETTTHKKTEPQDGAQDKGTRQADEIATTLQYHYLPGNRLETITYPDGSVVRYRYEQARITDIRYTDAQTGDEATLAQDIVYAPFGGPQHWTYGNGLRQQTAFDLDGRARSIELVKPGFASDVTLWSQRYDYDLYNNIIGIERAKSKQQFSYDALHRLTGERHGKSITAFTYDGVGNRLSETAANQTTTFIYSEGNRLSQRGDVNITLDGRGNLLEDHGKRFDYNRNHRPVNYYRNNQLTARYGYNANGLRTQKTTYTNHPPQTTRFAYAPDTRLLSETTGHQIRHYVWLGHTPIAQIDKTHPPNAKPQSQITYLHPDHLLTPRVATNDQQKIVWRWDSDAFGAAKPDGDPDGDGQPTQIHLRFPGQYADEESGLYYNVFRYYDPSSGRYTQSDPMGLVGGQNTYLYANANPLRYIDPLGLYTEIIIWQPVGHTSSSFGHVSANLNGTNYSWGPGGWDMKYPSAADYAARQRDFRSGSGVVLNLSPEQEGRLAACYAKKRGEYNSLTNNCGNPHKDCLEEVLGSSISNSFFPVHIGNDLLDSPYYGGSTYYPGPKRGFFDDGFWAR